MVLKCHVEQKKKAIAGNCIIRRRGFRRPMLTTVAVAERQLPVASRLAAANGRRPPLPAHHPEVGGRRRRKRR